MGLDVAKLVNDKVVEFGNERFLEGWNGATEHLVKLLEELDPFGPIDTAFVPDLLVLIKGLQKKNEELLANPYYPSPYFTVIDEFDSDVFKVTATEWEKLNAELGKD